MHLALVCLHLIHYIDTMYIFLYISFSKLRLSEKWRFQISTYHQQKCPIYPGVKISVSLSNIMELKFFSDADKLKNNGDQCFKPKKIKLHGKVLQGYNLEYVLFCNWHNIHTVWIWFDPLLYKYRKQQLQGILSWTECSVPASFTRSLRSPGVISS